MSKILYKFNDSKTIECKFADRVIEEIKSSKKLQNDLKKCGIIDIIYPNMDSKLEIKLSIWDKLLNFLGLVK